MVLVGLGSNQGDSVGIIRAALDRLTAFAAGPLRRSRLYRTSPVDCPPGSSDFVNAAAAFTPLPDTTPEGLLAALKALEREFGRTKRPVRNAPRELDLDLLLFGDEVRQQDDFVLPHPRAVDRLFVLEPAAELLPAVVWPGTRRTIAELRDALESSEEVEPIEHSR